MKVQIGKLFSILVLGLMTACSYLPDPAPSPRVRDNFDSNWRFHLGEAAGAEQPSFDDSQWRQLNLPHDWAIEGDFSADNPSGRASTIWASLPPTDFLPAAHTSASSTLPVSPKTYIICIKANGPTNRYCTSSPIGTTRRVSLSTYGATTDKPMRWNCG